MSFRNPLPHCPLHETQLSRPYFFLPPPISQLIFVLNPTSPLIFGVTSDGSLFLEENVGPILLKRRSDSLIKRCLRSTPDCTERTVWLSEINIWWRPTFVLSFWVLNYLHEKNNRLHWDNNLLVGNPRFESFNVKLHWKNRLIVKNRYFLVKGEVI